MVAVDHNVAVTMVRRLWSWFADAPIPLAAEHDGPRAAITSSQHTVFADAGAFLCLHFLEPSPENYALAHGVVTQASPRLLAAVTAEIDRSGTLGAAAAERIFDEAGAGATSDALAELADRMARQATGLTTIARQSGRDANQFAVALEAQSRASVDTVTIITLAQTMVAQTRVAERQLRHAQKELVAMRSTLAEAQREANVDGLTKLLNRRAFKRALATMIADAQASGKPLSLAFCDIDHFKSINDRFGHATGDRVLRYVATALAHDLGTLGLVGRFGGEEFVIAMPKIAVARAKTAIDACRIALAERRLVCSETDLPIGSVTFSAGIAGLTADDDSATLLKRADDALYDAKNNGRNRVTIG